MTRRIITTLAALAIVAGLSTVPAFADDQHGRPVCTTPPMDEAALGSRDGFDHHHLISPDVRGSLVDVEGFLNVCRTSDSTIEGASGSARAILVSGVRRVGLRAQVQQWNGTAWVTVLDSAAVNTGVNRTLTVTTPFDTVDAGQLESGWTRVNIRALVRYSDNSLVFYQRQTYPVAVDASPTAPLPS